MRSMPLKGCRETLKTSAGTSPSAALVSSLGVALSARHPPSALIQGDRLEAFQVGWAKHHALGEGLTAMGLDEAVGFCPGKKCLFRGPGRMRHVVNGIVVAL